MIDSKEAALENKMERMSAKLDTIANLMKDLKKDGDREKSNVEKEIAAVKKDMVQTVEAQSPVGGPPEDVKVIPQHIVAQMKKVFEDPKDKVVAETDRQVP